MIEYTVKVYPNGDKYWYLNGKYHREDGPAVEWVDEAKEWYKDGKRHRENGPAVEYHNGDKYWYVNGKYLTEEEFNQRIKKHTIIVDGKTIEISEESYQKMKDTLTS